MRPARMAVVAAATVLTALATGPAAVAETPGHAPQQAGVAIQETELTVPTADGLTLPATLRTPVGGAPGGPALVLVHGAGVGPREKYRAEAEAFARAGVVTLAYDKRTVGYSLTERSYSQLADDANAAADVLRSQPGVDPDAVGLLGISEGGWVAPLAASRAPETAFVVVVGGNGLGPLRQQTWAEAVKVEAAGVEGSLVDAASSGMYRLINDMGMFPEPYYDPAPVLQSLRMPVLGVWGALDRSTPPVETVAAFRENLDRAGNQHYTLRTFDAAEHSLRATTTGFEEGADFAPGYVELVGEWTADVAAGTPAPTSVTGTGLQTRDSVEVPPAAWYESAPAHGVALLVMVIGFAGFGLVAAARTARRVIRRPQTDGSLAAAPVAARVIAVTGLAAVVGTMAYLATLTIVRGGHTIDPGPLVAGRTLPWLGLQVLAVATVIAGIVLVAQWWRGREVRRGAVERVRLGLLLAAGAVFVPWSLYWGLLLP